MSTLVPGHYVHIIGYSDAATVKTLGPYASPRLAEQAERGVLRNLSGDYYTLTEEVR